MFQRHMVEIRIEFFRQYHGDRSVDPLTHFDLRHDESDPAVAIDANECIGRKRRLLGLRAVRSRQVESDYQTAPATNPVCRNARLVNAARAELGLCCMFDRLSNANVGAAPADVPSHGRIDVGVCRVRVDVE